MKRRRISPIMIAGLLALLSALGLIALISSGSVMRDLNPTDMQLTRNGTVQTRMTQTADMRATLAAVTETASAIDPLDQQMTEMVRQATQTNVISLGSITPAALSSS